MIVLNIVIISLILSIVLTTPKVSQFNCGIFGFYGDMKNFNWDKFNILGLSNESRGKDALGIAGNTFSVKYEDIKYGGFLKKFKLPTIGAGEKIVLGHVRTTSSMLTGNKGINYAQPIQMEDYLFAHNGTVYNQDNLRHKCEISDHAIKNDEKIIMNDSMILSQIIKKEKYDALKDYEGSAAFVYYDKTKDRLILWSGKSNNFSGYLREERPLKLLKSEKYMWFSSVEDPLWYISEDDSEIDQIDYNKLLIFEGMNLIEEISIDRSNSFQNQQHKSDYTTHRSTYVAPVKPKQLSLPLPKEHVGQNKSKPNQKKGVIEFDGEFYFLNGEKAHGMFHLDTMGTVYKSQNLDEAIFPWEVTQMYYFIHGYMIEDMWVESGEVNTDDSYFTAHQLFQKWNRKVGKKNKNFSGIRIMDFAKECCEYPIYYAGRLFNPQGESGDRLFTGKLLQPFSEHGFIVEKGKIVGVCENINRHPVHFDESPSDDELGDYENADVIHDNFGFSSDMEEALAVDEIKQELSTLLNRVKDAATSISIYSDYPFGKQSLQVLEGIELTIEDLS